MDSKRLKPNEAKGEREQNDYPELVDDRQCEDVAHTSANASYNPISYKNPHYPFVKTYFEETCPSDTVRDSKCDEDAAGKFDIGKPQGEIKVASEQKISKSTEVQNNSKTYSADSLSIKICKGSETILEITLEGINSFIINAEKLQSAVQSPSKNVAATEENSKPLTNNTEPKITGDPSIPLCANCNMPINDGNAVAINTKMYTEERDSNCIEEPINSCSYGSNYTKATKSCVRAHEMFHNYYNKCCSCYITCASGESVRIKSCMDMDNINMRHGNGSVNYGPNDGHQCTLSRERSNADSGQYAVSPNSAEEAQYHLNRNLPQSALALQAEKAILYLFDTLDKDALIRINNRIGERLSATK